MLKTDSPVTDRRRRLFSNPRHNAITRLIFVLLLATLFAHVWFGSAPLPLGGPNVILAAAAVALSLAYLLCAIRIEKRGAIIAALAEDFRPVIPMIAVSVSLLIWGLAVHLFTDARFPTRLGQTGMGIGILFAVYLCVDSVRRGVLMAMAIILATFVSALFGMGVLFFGDPFFSFWRYLALVEERQLAHIWQQSQVAGLSPDFWTLNFQLVVAICLAFAAFLHDPFGKGKMFKATFALYFALMGMVTVLIINTSRSGILGVLFGAIFIAILSMQRPRVWRRLSLAVPLIAMGHLIFLESLPMVAALIGDDSAADKAPTARDEGPTVDGLATGFDSLIDAPGKTIGCLITGLTPGWEYAIQLRVQKAHGYEDHEIIAKTGKNKQIVLTWREIGDPTGIIGYRYRLRPVGETQWWPWWNLYPRLSSDGPTLYSFEKKRKIGANRPILRISDKSAQSRMPMASAALRYALDHPLGTGGYFPNPSHLSAGLDPWIAERVLAHIPHNQFLVILVYYGFPGLILLILFYLLVFRSLIYSGRIIALSQDAALHFLATAVVGALVAYGIASLFNNTGPFLGDWYHFFLLGLVFSIQRIATSRKENVEVPRP